MDLPGKLTFYRTTRGNRHYHVLFVSPDGRVGISAARGHSHVADWDWDIQDIPDPQTGAMRQVRTGTGSVVVTTAEDGHTHDLDIVVPTSNKVKPEEDSDIVRTVKRLWQSATTDEEDYIKRGVESEKFYSGEGQWDKTEKQNLKDASRAALTFNEIEPKIDTLSGYQRQNRYDIRYLPIEDGDARVAEIITAVVKNIMSQNDFPVSETEAFEDETLTGRGNMNLLVDFSKNIDGEIVLEHYPWKDVVYGPHNKKDGSDLEYLVKQKWYSLAKVKQKWPEKAEDIQREMEDAAEWADHHTYSDDQYAHGGDGVTSFSYDPSLVNIAKKEFRVLECWRKEYTKIDVLIDSDTEEITSTRGWSEKDVKMAKSISGFLSLPRDSVRTRITTTAGGVKLGDGYSSLFTDFFGMEPIYAKKRGKRIWGKVDNAKDPQREENKRLSQGMDILNKVASYGWFIDDTTFATPEEKEKFRRTSSTPGFVAEVQNINNKPVKEEGVRFPTELTNYTVMMSNKIRDVLNITPVSGEIRSDVSGAAIEERRKEGLTGNEFLFDNLALAKRNIGRKLLKLVAKIYTPDRILRLLKNSNYKDQVVIDGKPFDEQDQGAIRRLLEDSDLLKYDVEVSESKHSPTVKMANFLMWADIARQRPEVPLSFLIKLSDLPDKDEYLQMFEQQQQQAQQQEQQKYQTEIQKAQIASANKGNGAGTPQ